MVIQQHHWGYTTEYLEAIGRLVISMARTEALAALLVNRLDPNLPATRLLRSTDALEKGMQQVGKDDPAIGILAARLTALREERNRVIHDVPGIRQKRGNQMVPVVLRTGDRSRFEIQEPRTPESVSGLAMEVESLCGRIGKHYEELFGSDPFKVTAGWGDQPDGSPLR